MQAGNPTWADQRGFTYLGLLLAIALVGLGLSGAAEVWSTTARRQQLEQLEFAGQQYVQAIGSYYESTPSGPKRFPPTVQDLLLDQRFVFVRRHLRQAFVNPFSGRADWEFVFAQGGGIRGLAVVVPLTGQRREFSYLPTQSVSSADAGK